MKSILLLMVFILPQYIKGEIVSGTDTITASFDFSYPDCPDTINWDKYDLLIATQHFPYHAIKLVSGVGIIEMDTAYTLEEITVAPDTGYSLDVEYNFKNDIFCLITNEKHYVKFRFSIDSLYILEWVYQDNGTRNFTETVMKNQKGVNWGDLKNIFKGR